MNVSRPSSPPRTAATDDAGAAQRSQVSFCASAMSLRCSAWDSQFRRSPGRCGQSASPAQAGCSSPNLAAVSDCVDCHPFLFSRDRADAGLLVRLPSFSPESRESARAGPTPTADEAQNLDLLLLASKRFRIGLLGTQKAKTPASKVAPSRYSTGSAKDRGRCGTHRFRFWRGFAGLQSSFIRSSFEADHRRRI